MERVTFAHIRQAIPEDAVLVDFLEYSGKSAGHC